MYFIPEQEAQLQIAATAGTDPERFGKEAALRLLQESTRFVPLCIKVSPRRTGASSSKKKRWMPASKRGWARKCAFAACRRCSGFAEY
jgi:hypothetical protein